MTDTPIDTWKVLEAAAFNRAVETRAHFRRCRTCQGENELCPVGADLLGRLNAGLSTLGDRMTARARVVRALIS